MNVFIRRGYRFTKKAISYASILLWSSDCCEEGREEGFD